MGKQAKTLIQSSLKTIPKPSCLISTDRHVF